MDGVKPLPMTYQEFRDSLGEPRPPATAAEALRVLWYAARDDWDRAHDIAQDMPGADGAWLHAYLHRVEGDAFNAGYWYRKADRPIPDTDLQSEWEQLVRYFVKATPGGE